MRQHQPKNAPPSVRAAAHDPTVEGTSGPPLLADEGVGVSHIQALQLSGGNTAVVQLEAEDDDGGGGGGAADTAGGAENLTVRFAIEHVQLEPARDETLAVVGTGMGLTEVKYTPAIVTERAGDELVVTGTMETQVVWNVNGGQRIDVSKELYRDHAKTSTDAYDMSEDIDPEFGEVANVPKLETYWVQDATIAHEEHHVEDFGPLVVEVFAAAIGVFEEKLATVPPSMAQDLAVFADDLGQHLKALMNEKAGALLEQDKPYYERQHEAEAFEVNAALELAQAQVIWEYGETLEANEEPDADE